ncbi:hypothetical protein V8C34DRAFT_242733 [Trichoderma compactum]
MIDLRIDPFHSDRFEHSELRPMTCLRTKRVSDYSIWILLLLSCAGEPAYESFWFRVSLAFSRAIKLCSLSIVDDAYRDLLWRTIWLALDMALWTWSSSHIGTLLIQHLQTISA